MSSKRYLSQLVAVTLLMTAVLALADEPVLPEVTSLMGLDSSTGEGWLAIKVLIPADHALEGVMWYNNDGSLPFPEALVGTGHAAGPGPISEALVIAEEVAGESLGWSTLIFSEPVAASQGSLYLTFKLPSGAEYTAPGEGGGPAVGYYDIAEGSPGWISGDGEFWARLHHAFNFAILPLFVPYEEGMTVKSLDGDAQETPVLRTYLRHYPNPFNPQATIAFGLRRDGHVEISIYNLRGMRVIELVNENFPAGRHAVIWQGRDGKGRNVASGAYFARMKVAGEVLTQRMMLVR